MVIVMHTTLRKESRYLNRLLPFVW